MNVKRLGKVIKLFSDEDAGSLVLYCSGLTLQRHALYHLIVPFLRLEYQRQPFTHFYIFSFKFNLLFLIIHFSFTYYSTLYCVSSSFIHLLICHRKHRNGECNFESENDNVLTDKMKLIRGIS